MTDIDKRIDEIMERIAKAEDDLYCPSCSASCGGDNADALIEAGEIIKHLQAEVVERDALIKTLGTGVEIVLFTPDLPLMKCEIEGLRKAEAKYKEWKKLTMR